MVILVLVVLVAPRRWALLGMMAGVLYVPQAQTMDIMGFNMFSVRFLELAGFIRVLSRREFSFSKLNTIDRALLLLYGYTAIVYSLRATQGYAYAIGIAADACLCYFTFRGLVGGVEDFRRFLRDFVILLTPFVCLVLIESLTHQDPFVGMMGPLNVEWFRENMVRCRGSFRHPSLLGTLGASFFPLYLGLAFTSADRVRACFGVGLSLAIVWASNSGGPLGMTVAGLIGWMVWVMRTRMRAVRWGILGFVALAALLMKAPVWYLLARLSSVTGGDGWHRSYLIDVTVRHYREWWIAGMPPEATIDWFPYYLASTGGADLTNQFISFALAAGLGAVTLFVYLLSRGFAGLGRALATVRSRLGPSRDTEYLLWGLGAVLTAHITNWFGISYWDQMYAVWFMQLAVISNLSDQLCLQGTVPAEAEIASEVDALWPEDERTGEGVSARSVYRDEAT
ncbi:MAG TPA: hypothetical protein VMP11_19455 [Verrucomicrobiae bacterium]|nr:hypothetical protein [Verrucomicrobiae bacterium]